MSNQILAYEADKVIDWVAANYKAETGKDLAVNYHQELEAYCKYKPNAFVPQYIDKDTTVIYMDSVPVPITHINGTFSDHTKKHI